MHDISGETGFTDPNSRLEPIGVPVVQFGRIIRRHAWLVLGCLLLGAGGTLLLVSRMPRQYTAEATILIEPQRTQVSDLQAISADAGDVSSLIRTQIDILSAPALAIGVVQALDLTRDPEFRVASGGLKERLGRLLRHLTGSSATTLPVANDPVDLAAAELSDKIAFANEPHSDVLHILVTTRHAALSARIANAIVRQYLDFKRQEKFIAMQRARDWFQQQLGTLGEQVRTDETKVERYRQQHGLRETLSTEAGNPTTSSANRQQLDAVSTLLAQVSRDRAEKEAQLAEAQMAQRGGTPISALPEIVNSPMIARLVEQISEVAGKEAEMAESQGERNPDLAAVRSQLAKLQARAAREMNNIAHSLASAVNAAREQEDGLQSRLDQLRDAVSDENSAQIGLQTLETKTRATRTIYESFLNRATELANTAGIQDPDAALVSGARPPLEPSSPQSTRMVAIAIILSLALGVALACARERMRRGFTMPEQLEAHLGLPLIGIVPAERRALFGRRDISAAGQASFDKLRGRFRALGGDRPKVVMVTSAVPEEGKSVFAANWARNAALAGWQVLLIECDFGHPTLGRLLSCNGGTGLGDILFGKLIGGGKTTARQISAKLDVIVAGDCTGDPQELLASSAMSALIESSRANYDLIILDTPPVLPVADALVLAHLVDATLMVVRWEQTARDAVQSAVRLLQDSGAKNLGAVMTRVDRRIISRASGLGHYGYRGYAGRGRTRVARI